MIKSFKLRATVALLSPTTEIEASEMLGFVSVPAYTKNILDKVIKDCQIPTKNTVKLIGILYESVDAITYGSLQTRTVAADAFSQLLKIK